MPLKRYNEVFSGKSKKKAPEMKKIKISELDAESLMLLLSDENDSLLTQALLQLSHVESNEERAILDNVEVVQKLLEILEYKQEKCLTKLCLKLMTYLVKTGSGGNVFCNDLCLGQIFIDVLIRAEDSATLELCLYILSILTIQKDHCDYLVSHFNILEFLVNEIVKNADIDVQFNCVKILENMLVHGVIQSTDQIPIHKIIELLLYSGIERLQSSCLNVIYKSTELQDPNNNFGKDMLDQLGSFVEAFDLVDDWLSDDQKVVLLYVISTFPLQFFDIKALKKLLELINKPDITPNLLTALINILNNVCASDNCQDHVIEMDIPHVLVKYLNSDNIQVSHAACQGVRIICGRYRDYRQEVSSDQAIINHMFQVLSNELVDDLCKARFCELLLVMMENDTCCDYITGNQEPVTQISVPYIVKTNVLLNIAVESSCEDLTTIILSCIHKLSYSHDCIDSEQLKIVLDYFHNKFIQNNTKTETFLEVLSLCLASPMFVKLFIDLSGLLIIDNYMMHKSNPELLIAYGNLLISAGKHPYLAGIINKLNVFQWMNKHMLEKPIWQRIIFNFFNINLSLKFAYCNALHFVDITTNGFYVFQHVKHVNLFDFPDLDRVLHEKDHDKVVYVYTRDQAVSYKDNYIDKYISDITTLLRVANNIHMPEMPELSLLSLFSDNVELSDKQNDGIKQNWKQDLEIIANYVVNQMNGYGDDTENTQNLYNNHIKEITEDSNSSVIPIGHVKIGLKFERCLLFKVLCDVFGYPCTLVRDEYSEDCYNQVSIECDDVPVESADSEMVAQNLSRKLIYYTVDLMSHPACLKPTLSESQENACKILPL